MKTTKLKIIISILLTSVFSLNAAIPTSILNTSEMFTDRDLEQNVNIYKATSLKLESDQEVLIDEEGIYLLTGDFENTMIIVEASDNDKIQFVLDNLNIKNVNKPAIYIKSADKVFVTTTNSKNYLTVSSNYLKDGDTNLDSVIFSRSDLIFNGKGTLNINSVKGNGISSKDDLKITGGNIIINALKDGIEANDSIRIFDGTITIKSGADALHSENEDNLLKGYIYIKNGSLDITTGDDGIRGTSIVQIDGGNIKIHQSQEGIEATHIRINGGEINIYATDDGINATAKSSLDVIIEVYGGNITVKMASGDTDAFDSNGELYIYGGIIDIEGQSSFDADSTSKLINGSVTINGTQVTELPQGRNGRGKHRN